MKEEEEERLWRSVHGGRGGLGRGERTEEKEIRARSLEDAETRRREDTVETEDVEKEGGRREGANVAKGLAKETAETRRRTRTSETPETRCRWRRRRRRKGGGGCGTVHLIGLTLSASVVTF